MEREYREKEKLKAETEVLEKKEKIFNGDENVPGLSKVKDKRQSINSEQ